ncbi:MAG: 16S rRNA (cytosine(1402)-N(4))-methyltransferase RsmH, partial [Clostridia bacterium]|nr:16S rRNA (cytosine(1402)-N(4))-methyltransferase RsmH [Clostridia bacterium]
MEYRHTTVLLHEAVDQLVTDPDGVYVDCTLGGAGHTSLLLTRLSGKGRVIGIDRDEAAIRNAEETLHDPRLILCRSNYTDIDDIVRRLASEGVNGILADLGVSSPQLDDPERGFSYASDARLDMRMDRDQAFSAYDVVNTYTKEDLVRILRDYGEERFAGRIADRILRARENGPIETTSQLTAVVAPALPKADKKEGHPCKRT